MLVITYAVFFVLIGLAIIGVGIWFVLGKRSALDRGKSAHQALILLMILTCGLSLEFVVRVLGWEGLIALSKWVSDPRTGPQSGFVVMAALAALALFALRLKFRGIYGTVEVLFGIFGLSWYPKAPTVSGNEVTPIFAVWLIGGMTLIYVIVRGLDNIHQSVARNETKAA